VWALRRRKHLQGYRLAWLPPDVIAGLTVWAVLVSHSLACPSVAGYLRWWASTRPCRHTSLSGSLLDRRVLYRRMYGRVEVVFANQIHDTGFVQMLAHAAMEAGEDECDGFLTE
jgi:hypothetical protein